MADIEVEIGLDAEKLEEGADKTASFFESRFQKAGSTAGRSFAQSFGGFTKGIWDRLTGESKRYNTTVEDHLKLNKERNRQESERLKTARDILREHRDALTVQKADAVMRGGGPGNRRVGMYGGTRRGHREGLSYLADGVGGLGNYFMSGGSDQGTMQLLSGVGQAALSASGANPAWSQMLNVVTGMVMSGLDAYDRQREAGLRGFQVGGRPGANMVMNRPRTGALHSFTAEQRSGMYANLKRSAGDIDSGTLSSIAELESQFGLGAQGTRLLGSARRGGIGSQQDATVLGTAIGLSVAAQLDRGRFGESFDQISRALDASTRAVADVGGIANRVLFISQLGPQYKGDTGAARQMEGTLQGLAGGNTPFTRLTALQAGGLGAGASYAEASLRVASGMTENAQGLQLENVLRTNFGRYIARWAKASATEKASLSLSLAQLTGANQREIYTIMERLAAGPLGKVSPTPVSGEVPHDLMRPRYDAAEAEDNRVWIGKKAAHVGDAVTGNDFSPTNTNAGSMGVGDYAPPAGGGASPVGGYGTTSKSFMDKYVTGKTGGYNAMRAGRAHPGIDLVFPPNTEVKAPDNGTIGYVGFFGTNGKPKDPNNGHLVVLNGTVTGMTFKMYHLWNVSVKSGQEVKRGDVIGRTRATDWAKTKSHLHAETYVKGKNVDPSKAMNLEDFLGTQPTGTTPAPSNSPGITAGGDGQSTGPGTAKGTAQATSTQVTVIVEDRTKHGVTVQEAQAGFNNKVREPSPGDVPALSE